MDNIFCEDFHIEKALGVRGGKTYGYHRIAHKPDGTWLSIPVMVVAGYEAGPIYLVDGAHRGNEYEGVQAIIRAANDLDPKNLKGTFVGVPAINTEAFMYGARVSPMDYSTANLNRVYPGSENGFIHHRIAHEYFEKFVKHADYLVSFHGGGDDLYLESLAAYPSDNPKNAEMARAFGVSITWRMDELPFEGVLALEASKLGIPVISPEIGSQSVAHPLGQRQKYIDVAYTGIFNTLKFAGMLEGKPVMMCEEQTDITLVYLSSREGGIHIPKKMPPEPVKKGEVLAEVFDLFGRKVGDTRAPDDGIIVGYACYPVVLPGNWSILFGYVN